MRMAVQNITPDELDQMIKSGKNVSLIDVVNPLGFAESHVSGSINLPLKTLDPSAVMQLRGGKSSEPLYIICKVGINSKKACEHFIAAGFDQVINVEGGKIAWKKAGLPLKRHPKSMLKDPGLRIACGIVVLMGSILAVWVHPAFLVLPLTAGSILLFFRRFCE